MVIRGEGRGEIVMTIIRFQTWEGGRVWFRYRVREWKRRGGKKWGGETLLWGRVDELGFSILEVQCQWLTAQHLEM